MFKQRLIDCINLSADKRTRDDINNFTEKEAELFCSRIEKDIHRSSGATPVATIMEVRKYDTGLSYKLSFETFVLSNMSLEAPDDL